MVWTTEVLQRVCSCFLVSWPIVHLRVSYSPAVYFYLSLQLWIHCYLISVDQVYPVWGERCFDLNIQLWGIAEYCRRVRVLLWCSAPWPPDWGWGGVGSCSSGKSSERFQGPPAAPPKHTKIGLQLPPSGCMQFTSMYVQTRIIFVVKTLKEM